MQVVFKSVAIDFPPHGLHGGRWVGRGVGGGNGGIVMRGDAGDGGMGG